MNLLLKKTKVEEEKHLKEINKMKAENSALKAQNLKINKQEPEKLEKSSFKLDIDKIKAWIE